MIMIKKGISKSFLVSILLIVVLLSVGFGVAKFYEQECRENMQKYRELELKRAQEQEIKNFKIKLQAHKQTAQKTVDNLNTYFLKSYKQIEDEIKNELKKRVDHAYNNAQYIYNRYHNKQGNKNRITDIVKHISVDSANSIFITDFYGDAVLLGPQKIEKSQLNFFMDADARSIILEELQKVRKHKEGFLESNFYQKDSKYIIYVKDLNMFSMFIGSMISVDEVQKKFEKNAFELLSAVVLGDNEFLLFYKNSKKVFASKEIDIGKIEKNASWQKIGNVYYYSQYNKVTGFSIVYGFELDQKSELLKKK